MPRSLPSALAALVVVACAAPGAAAATGGAPAPAADTGPSGGSEYGAPLASKAGGDRPVSRFFRVTPTAQEKTPVHFAFRIDGLTRYVRVRVDVAPVGARRPAYRLDLGRRRTGRRIVWRWASAPAAGSYVVALHAVDLRGHALAHSARSAARAPLTVTPIPAPVATPAPLPAPVPAPVSGNVAGRFPVQGAHGFGGADARFGAARNGHTHQGQDVTAAEGTPLVAPVAGTVVWIAYQAQGAGHYLVIRGDDGRDYVLMHLQQPPVVGKDQRVAAGQGVGAVGSTGDAQGPHLHFEIWVGGWQAKGGQPIDPLPQLRAWDAGR